MREFRGKREDNGEWAVGYYLKICDKHKIYVPFTEEEKKFFKHSKYEKLGGRYKTVIPETVGQFTGEYDKNKKPICEGDILEYKKEKFVVVFQEGAFCHYYLRDYAMKKGSPAAFNDVDYYLDTDESEIIGNIHDNPELIEKERI